MTTSGVRSSEREPDLHGRHRGLLQTFVELLEGLDRAESGQTEEALRAVLSFLRHGVLAFAHGEERGMNAHPWLEETAAFEHAFLEAEIESLGREARPLLDAMDGAPRPTVRSESEASLQGDAPRTTPESGPPARDALDVAGLDRVAPRMSRPGVTIDCRAFERVRRRLHRIEAILEMHICRDEELLTPAPPAVSARSGGGLRTTARNRAPRSRTMGSEPSSRESSE